MTSENIARLRNLKAKHEQQEHADGLEAGRMWANKVEDWRDLLVMSKLHGPIDSAALKAAFVEAHYDEADFRGTPFSCDYEPSDEFAAGFHEGLMEVFDAVNNVRFIEDGGPVVRVKASSRPIPPTA
ncbi:hypothetical protein K9U40_04905 [Xanthobacter autotrophicus]|uniref:hypothetical protein n=1 Tax=Xanthobacter TaxID=279 RepID=UPI0024AA8239|nr:hypothetical protein [Xanthobacter autotrophicus]MDI4663672.1 hypothetical protein [Xanthobacter autotrophicus]